MARWYHPAFGEPDEHLYRMIDAWGPEWPLLHRIDRDEVLRLEVLFADGNPAPVTDEQFAYRRGGRYKAEWSAKVFRLTQTIVAEDSRDDDDGL